MWPWPVWNFWQIMLSEVSHFCNVPSIMIYFFFDWFGYSRNLQDWILFYVEGNFHWGKCEIAIFGSQNGIRSSYINLISNMFQPIYSSNFWTNALIFSKSSCFLNDNKEILIPQQSSTLAALQHQGLPKVRLIGKIRRRLRFKGSHS